MSQGRLSPSQLAEVCQITVPSAAVGALIGSGGANIKQVIRDSGAFVTVSQSHTQSEVYNQFKLIILIVVVLPMPMFIVFSS